MAPASQSGNRGANSDSVASGICLPTALEALATSTAGGAGRTSMIRSPLVAAITTLANMRPGRCSDSAIFWAV